MITEIVRDEGLQEIADAKDAASVKRAAVACFTFDCGMDDYEESFESGLLAGLALANVAATPNARMFEVSVTDGEDDESAYFIGSLESVRDRLLALPDAGDEEEGDE